MFVVGIVGWRVAQSSDLLADTFDRLADATAYAFATWAVGRSSRHQRMAARWNCAMLVVSYRWIAPNEPVVALIMRFAIVSLVINDAVLLVLSEYRHSQEPHPRATWIGTRADVLVNLGVLLSGAAIAVTGSRVVDLLTVPS